MLKENMDAQSNPQGKPNEIRRSRRIALSVPLIAYREARQGAPFDEGTQTQVVNAHGGLISLSTRVMPKQTLMLKHSLSGQVLECRIVYVGKKLAGPADVGFEFTQPAPKFWQIAFPPADWPRA